MKPWAVADKWDEHVECVTTTRHAVYRVRDRHLDSTTSVFDKLGRLDRIPITSSDAGSDVYIAPTD